VIVACPPQMNRGPTPICFSCGNTPGIPIVARHGLILCKEKDAIVAEYTLRFAT